MDTCFAPGFFRQLSPSDIIKAASAIALSYFAWVQVRRGRPIVFAWAEDWRDLYIENSSDYPIFDIRFSYTDVKEEFGLRSDKIKVIYAQKREKIALLPELQGKPSMIIVTIEFRTGDIQGPLHTVKNEVLLRKPGSLF